MFKEKKQYFKAVENLDFKKIIKKIDSRSFKEKLLDKIIQSRIFIVSTFFLGLIYCSVSLYSFLISSGMMNVVNITSYSLGTLFGVSGLLKLKKHGEAPNTIPLSTPIILILLSFILLSLHTFLYYSS